MGGEGRVGREVKARTRGEGEEGGAHLVFPVLVDEIRIVHLHDRAAHADRDERVQSSAVQPIGCRG